MLNEINISCTNAIAVGDLHGYFNSLVGMIKRYEITDTCIIICGDCGLGFYKPNYYKDQFSKISAVCRKLNDTVVMVRGNHDDPSYFSEGKANTYRVIAVPDYTVVNGTILCVGGATSIDRLDRLNDEKSKVEHYMHFHPGASEEEARDNTPRYYWAGEQPCFDIDKLDEITGKGLNIRTVVTHTCPSFCHPSDKDGLEYWTGRDENLADDIDYERNVMDRLYEKLKADGHMLDEWAYGHYHEHKMQYHDTTGFYLLDGVVFEGGNPDWIRLKYVNI